MQERSRTSIESRTNARLSVGLAGLFLACWSLTGCGDSAAKQEAKSRDTAATQPASPPKTADSTASSGRRPSTASDFGFTKTWKPSAPASSSAASSAMSATAAMSAAVRPTTTDDDRYTNAAPPLPAVAAASAGPDRSPEGSLPSGDARYDGTRKTGFTQSVEATSPKGGTARAPDEASGPALPTTAAATEAPSGNPLRNGNSPAASGRPQTPPQPDPPPTGADPVSTVASTPATAPMQPEPAAAAPRPLPDTSAAAAPAAAPSVALQEDHSLDNVKQGPRTNKSTAPFDPIKENGKIFEGWPKPKLALVITGQQEGYLEPCGCAGLDRMKGGMSRRYTLFESLRNKGWPVVGLDVGGTAKGFSKQAEIKFQISVNSMNEMRYSSAALGKSDLMLPTEEVLSQVMPVNAQSKTMFVSGNVGLFSFDETLLPRTQLISTGYKTIGVTAILGKTYQDQLAGNSSVKTVSADRVLAEAVPLLKKSAGFMVLLAHATRKEAIELGKKYPDFNLVVCSEGAAEPPKDAEEITPGGPRLIEVGEKGMYAVVIGLFDDPQQPLRYQRVVLDSRFPAAPKMTSLMAAYQTQVKEMGLSGLGIRPQINTLKAANGDFVGSTACQNCHEESYRIWKKTPHSHAFSALQKATPPREYDPECIACHTVGWNTQTFLPYQTGYLSEKETPKLLNVGCEDCHGPGEKHCWAENHGTKADKEASRVAVRLTKEEAANPNCPKQNCFSCHDLDNSPDFKFNQYFPFIRHYEKE